MRIKVYNGGKRFNREWIFRHADLELQSGNAYAITGPNGSGKSTLLQSLGGMLQLSEGSIEYTMGTLVDPAEAYAQISFCAPYLDVIEEMTLVEFLGFHQQFKPFLKDFSVEMIITSLGLEHAAGKQIRNFSSGMKQRVKLAQAVFSDTAVVLLDEPSSNLDENGIALYHSLISLYCSNRLVVVCSNDAAEYSFCNEVIPVSAFKGRERMKR